MVRRGLDVESFQDAHGFHHDDGAGAVVGGAGAGVPGVEVRAEHDDFIFLVGAGNFGDGVVLHGVIVVESVGDVEFEGDILFLLEQASDAGPVLGGHRELGDGGGLTGLVGAAGLYEDGAAAGGAAAVIDDGENFFVGVELVEIFLELAAAHHFGHAERRAFAWEFHIRWSWRGRRRCSACTEIR